MGVVNTQIQQILQAARPDPLLSFKWVCSDSSLPFGLPSHYLESVDLNFENIQVAEGAYGGATNTYYPGMSDISSINMTFYEDQEASAMQWIWEWKNRIKNFRTGFYKMPGGPDGYKKNMHVSLLDSKNNEIMIVELIGLWPEATSSWSLNYTDAGRLVVSQAFSIDDQHLQFKFKRQGK